MMQQEVAPGGSMILVVDDDPDSRSMLRAALAHAGLTALLAPDGTAALAILEAASPDLILLDAMMPPPDGFETCRLIKARPEWQHIPVIFMTGLADTDHVVQGLQSGGVDYVTKPLILDELLARIRVHLANARLTRNAHTALDVAGRSLIATDQHGRIRWSTPQAQQLIASMAQQEAVRIHAERMLASAAPLRPSSTTFEADAHTIELAFVGEAGNDEYFFRVTESYEGMEVEILQQRLGLTPRESDVLFWISRGKSNRDTSEILNISARTVNKHLEQIFVKLGVENRSAATAIAINMIASAR